jgi:hypothetical protein
MIGRLPPALFLVLLVAMPSYHVGAQEAGLPAWNVGDRWEYHLVVSAPDGTHEGNYTVRVTGRGTFNLGMFNGSAYILRTERTEHSNGYDYRTVSTAYVETASLCTVYSCATQVVTFGKLTSSSVFQTSYNPSEGRCRFPLSAGMNWTSEFSFNRSSTSGSSIGWENRTLTRQYSCQAREPVSVAAKVAGNRNFLAFHVHCPLDDMGSYSDYWYCANVRGELKFEQYERSSGARTVGELSRYVRVQPPAPGLAPDLDTALLLAGAAVALASISVLLLTVRNRMATRKPKPQPQSPDTGPQAFRFIATREGLTVKMNTVDIVCPSCRRSFKVVASAKAATCPYCGKVGKMR